MRLGRFAVIVAVLAGLLGLPLPAAADPDVGEVRKLTKQAAKLNVLYRGSIQSLEEIRIQVKKATDKSASLQKDLVQAKADVATIARNSYMTGPLDGMQLFSSPGDPSQMLGHAAVLQYLADERAGRVRRIQTLVEDAKKARAAADDKIDKLKKEIKNMQGKRREIERLLAKFGIQKPGGSEGLTPRMIAVRAEIMGKFPMLYGVGCLRAGDPGEHGKGRACDFMMSRGGTMATGADADRGDALAEWLIQNGARIGVMYIIWKQRYYDIRSGGGWDPMSDRGGVTANHYDHVHVSVF
ncbi:hypothetical protein ABT294_24225 [Nonomuraea sp. NPDC000554]|uniref:hypothetical protein n=1 Tax=Nonomuraea sp. NPDC000554 TaxID=3154259 RepID=UPI00331D6138